MRDHTTLLILLGVLFILSLGCATAKPAKPRTVGGHSKMMVKSDQYQDAVNQTLATIKETNNCDKGLELFFKKLDDTRVLSAHIPYADYQKIDQTCVQHDVLKNCKTRRQRIYQWQLGARKFAGMISGRYKSKKTEQYEKRYTFTMFAANSDGEILQALCYEQEGDEQLRQGSAKLKDAKSDYKYGMDLLKKSRLRDKPVVQAHYKKLQAKYQNASQQFAKYDQEQYNKYTKLARQSLAQNAPEKALIYHALAYSHVQNKDTLRNFQELASPLLKKHQLTYRVKLTARADLKSQIQQRLKKNNITSNARRPKFVIDARLGNISYNTTKKPGRRIGNIAIRSKYTTSKMEVPYPTVEYKYHAKSTLNMATKNMETRQAKNRTIAVDEYIADHTHGPVQRLGLIKKTTTPPSKSRLNNLVVGEVAMTIVKTLNDAKIAWRTRKSKGTEEEMVFMLLNSPGSHHARTIDTRLKNKYGQTLSFAFRKILRDAQKGR